MINNKGQVSLEYLLIFAISLILLISFSLPIATIALEKTSDVSDSLNVKNEISKLSNAISQVYGEGQGAKQTVHLDVDRPVTLKIYNSQIQTRILLSDGEYKDLKVDHNSNLASQSLLLDKGENTVTVEWPQNSENMIVVKNF